MGVVVWDSEALESKDDREDWTMFKTHAGISVACVIEAETGLPTFYTAGDAEGHDIEALAKRLEAAESVVSFNGLQYDNVVLGWTLGRRINIRHNCDLYARIRKACGPERWPKGSWKLDRICQDTLGFGKTEPDGASAPGLWKDGEMGKLFTYAFRDTWLTWRLYLHGKEAGFVVDPNGRELGVSF